jgi:hypothetical protein
MNSMLSMQDVLSYKEDNWGNQVRYVWKSEEKSQQQFRDNWKGTTI